jgi:chromate transporter
MDSRLLGLIVVFVPLSLLSFGGGQAIVADIQHQTVAVHGWLTDQQFVDLFAISRAAPGPSTLVAALIGWQVDGFLGALVATLAIYIPSSLVVFFATSWWHRNEGSPWRAAIERGLSPIAVGLVFAGAAAVLQAAHVNALGLATTAVCTAALYFTRIGPYTLVGLVAAFYIALQVVGLG